MPPDPGEPRSNAVLPPRRRGRVLLPTILILGALLVLFGIFTGLYTDFLWFKSVDYTSVWRTRADDEDAAVRWSSAWPWPRPWRSTRWSPTGSRPMYQPLSPEQQNLDRYRSSIEPFRKPIVIGASAAARRCSPGRPARGSGGRSCCGATRSRSRRRTRSSGSTSRSTSSRCRGGASWSASASRWSSSPCSSRWPPTTCTAGCGCSRAATARRRGRGSTCRCCIGLFVLLKAIAYWLDRYSLAVKSGDIGSFQFVGLTYTDVNAVLYSKVILSIISVICAGLFFANVVRRTWLLPGLGVGLLLLVAVLVGGVYPLIVQSFQVRPSERVKEAPFIERNIEATRTAYDIADAEITNYDATTDVEASAAAGGRRPGPERASARPDGRLPDVPGAAADPRLLRLHRPAGRRPLSADGPDAGQHRRGPRDRHRRRSRPTGGTGTTTTSSTPTGSASSRHAETPARRTASRRSSRATSRPAASWRSSSPASTSVSAPRSTRSSAHRKEQLRRSSTTPTRVRAGSRTTPTRATAASRWGRRSTSCCTPRSSATPTSPVVQA